MTSAFSWQNSISLCPASFRIPRPSLPVMLGVSWLPTFAFQSPIMKRTSFLALYIGLIIIPIFHFPYDKNWGTDNLRDLPGVIQLVSGRIRIQAKLVDTPYYHPSNSWSTNSLGSNEQCHYSVDKCSLNICVHGVRWCETLIQQIGVSGSMLSIQYILLNRMGSEKDKLIPGWSKDAAVGMYNFFWSLGSHMGFPGRW